MGMLIKIIAKYSELRDRGRYRLLRDKRESLHDRLMEKKLSFSETAAPAQGRGRPC